MSTRFSGEMESLKKKRGADAWADDSAADEDPFAKKKATTYKTANFIFHAKEVKFGGVFGDARVKQIFECMIQSGVNAFCRVNSKDITVKYGQVRDYETKKMVDDVSTWKASTIIEEYYNWVVYAIGEATNRISTTGEAISAAADVLKQASYKMHDNVATLMGKDALLQFTWENPRKTLGRVENFKYANGVSYIRQLTCLQCLNFYKEPARTPTAAQIKIISDATSRSLKPDANGVVHPYNPDAPENKEAERELFKLNSAFFLRCRKGIKLEIDDTRYMDKASECKYFGANDLFASLDELIVTEQDIKTPPTPERIEEIAKLHGLEVYWEIGQVNRAYPGYSYTPQAHAEIAGRRIRIDPGLKEFPYQALESLVHEILHFYLPEHRTEKFTNLQTNEVEEQWTDIHPLNFTLAEMAITEPIHKKARDEITPMLAKYERFKADYRKPKQKDNDDFVDDIVAKVKAKREKLANRKRARFTSMW